MKLRSVVIVALVAALTAVPVSSASAHGRFHGGPLLLPFVAVGAVVAGAAIIATAPFRAVGQEAVYRPYPQYYAPPPQVVYAAPAPRYYQTYPAYYQPAPYRYYAAPRGYY